MGIKFSNNASSNITHSLTADATSVSVTPGTGDLFPSLVEGKDYFYATLAGNNGLEIVKVTRRVLDTMTIERAQDGTPALIFKQGDLFELRIVAADFNDTFSEVNDKLEASITETLSIVDSALSSRAPILHSSSSTEYGTGSSEQYGHLKSHDLPDFTKTADTGYAFSPAGAAAMQDVLEGQLGDLSRAVTVQDSELRALIASEISTVENPVATGSTTPRPLSDRFADVANVKDFGAVGDGETDDTEAIRKAIQAGSSIFFPRGKYAISSQINIRKSIKLFGDHAVIDCKLDASGTNAVFDFGPSNYEKTTVYVQGSSIAKGDATITVDTTTGVQIGDYLNIRSNDYFDGVEGISGYLPHKKGELNRVQFVDGNTIYLAIPAQDDYDNSDPKYPVTVVVSNYTEDIEVCGLTFIGTGGGDQHTGANPTGGRAMHFNKCARVKVHDCTFTNFPRFAIHIYRCMDCVVANNTFIGRKLEDDSNDGVETSLWFTGVYFQAGLGFTFSGNTGSHMRRHVDVDAGYEVARNITINGNVATNCMNVVGTHGCEGVTISGNVGIGCRTGVAVRGKDVTIVGNQFGHCTGQYIIKLGGLSSDNQNYTEKASSGRVVVTGNMGSGGSIAAIWSNVDSDSMLVADNDFTNLHDGLRLSGRRYGPIKITGNTFTGSNFGFVLNQKAFGNLIETKDITISENTFANFARGIVMEGCTRDEPLDNVLITGNNFRDCATNSVRMGNVNGVGGFFGRRIVISNNILYGATPLSFMYKRLGQMPIMEGNSFADMYSNVGHIAANGALPTAGTFVQGQRVCNSTPDSNLNSGQICTSSGTLGSAGTVSASVTSGSKVATVNNISELTPGAFIKIAGAVEKARIESIETSTLTLTLSVAASATVNKAALTLVPPSFANYQS